MSTNTVPFSTQGQVTLGVDGSGQIRIGPVGESWTINSTSVTVSSRTKESQAKIYLNYVGDAYYIDGTLSGSLGDTTDVEIELADGQAIVVVWSGADSEATATVTIRGKRSQVARGFRA